MKSRIPLRAIIISDDKREIDHITSVASSLGIITVETSFSDASQGLLYCRENYLDILFFDMEISSYECFNFLASLTQNNRPVPYLVFLTRNLPHNIEFIVNAGFEYLMKPAEKGAMSEILDKISVTSIKNCYGTVEKIATLLDHVTFSTA
jgi:two-component SAPR family response regulator